MDVNILIFQSWLPGKGEKARDDIAAASEFTAHDCQKSVKFIQVFRAQCPFFDRIKHNVTEGKEPMNGIIDLVNAARHKLPQGDHTVFLNEFFKIVNEGFGSLFPLG